LTVTHILQGIDVGVFQRLQRLVQRRANVGLQVADRVPVRLFRDEEGVLVRVGELAGDHRFRHPIGPQIPGKLLALLIEEIG